MQNGEDPTVCHAATREESDDEEEMDDDEEIGDEQWAAKYR